MIIEQVDIINFKKYSQEKIHLGKRVVGIFGPNGSGKSTIFDAICWCLYGVTPTIGKEGQNVKQLDLIRDGQEDMGVEVTFIYDGQVYRVHRFLRKDGVTAAVRLEGELVARSSKEVSAYMTKTLGLDARAFISASFIRQNEIDLLTSQRSSKRKEIINRLFNLQLYDQFFYDARDKRKASDLDITRKEGEIDALRTEIERYSEALLDEGAIEKEIRGHEKTLSHISKELEKTASNKAELDAELDRLRGHERILSELSARKGELLISKEKHENELEQSVIASSRLPELREIVISLQVKKAELERMQPARDRFMRLSHDLVALEGSIGEKRAECQSAMKKNEERLSRSLERKRNAISKRDQISAEITSARKDHQDISGMEAQLGGINEELAKIGDRISKEKQEKARLTAINNAISKEGEILSGLSRESKCPTCKQPLADDLKMDLIKKNELEASNYSKLLERTNTKLEKLNALLDERTMARDDLNSKIRKQREVQAGLSSKQTELDGFNEQIREADGNIMELKGENRRLVSEMDEKVDSFEKRITDIRNEMSALDFSEERFDSTNKDLRGYEAALEKKQKMEAMAERQITIRGELSSMEEVLEEIDEKMKKHSALVSGMPGIIQRQGSVESESSSLREERSRLQVVIGRLSQKLESNASVKARRKELRQALKEKEQELSALKKTSKQYELLSDAFKNIPINVHERLKPLVQMEVSHLHLNQF